MLILMDVSVWTQYWEREYIEYNPASDAHVAKESDKNEMSMWTILGAGNSTRG